MRRALLLAWLGVVAVSASDGPPPHARAVEGAPVALARRWEGELPELKAFSNFVQTGAQRLRQTGRIPKRWTGPNR